MRLFVLMLVLSGCSVSKDTAVFNYGDGEVYGVPQYIHRGAGGVDPEIRSDGW